MRHLLCLSVLLMLSIRAVAQDYPNELDGFELYEKYCSKLEPMKSSIDDVKKALGEPIKRKSGPLVLWYEKDSWIILVYICPDNGHYPPWHAGKTVKSIDFIPVERTPFNKKKFSKAFNKQDVRAADATWDEYYDSYGLVYEIYTCKPRFGNTQPGDLNRVSYRAPPHKVIDRQYFRIRRLLDDKAEKKDQQKTSNQSDAGDGK